MAEDLPVRNRGLLSNFVLDTKKDTSASRLDRVARSRLGESVLTGTVVADLAAGQVNLQDGSTLTARAVIDGRGPTASPHLDVRFQKFGQRGCGVRATQCMQRVQRIDRARVVVSPSDFNQALHAACIAELGEAHRRLCARLRFLVAEVLRESVCRARIVCRAQ